MPTRTMAEQPPPPPRRMSFAAVGGMTQFAILFGGIWFVVGGILFIVFTLVGEPIWDDWILDERGVGTDGQPLGVEATSSTRGNWQRIYTIQFRFFDLDGKVHEAEGGTTDHSLIAQARAGKSVAIEYDPQFPAKRVRLAGDSASRFGNAIFVPVGFAVAGLLFVLWGFNGVLRDRALYREGEAVEAKVIAVTPTAMRMNKRRVMRVTYTFQQPQGVIRGSWRTTNPPAVEAVMWVIYDPQHPERNIAVPL